MKEIKNHIHKFKIGDDEIELTINAEKKYYNNISYLYWTCKPKGNTPIGTCQGGDYNSLEDYIKHMEREHTYGYNFFKYGHKEAKESIKNAK